MTLSRASLLLATLALAACQNVTQPSDLVGGRWELNSLTTAAGATFAPEDRSRFTVEFGEDGRLSLRADCNSCGGTWRLDGQQLVTGPLACTLVACTDDRGGQFAAVIDGRSTVSMQGVELRLSSDDGSAVLVR